MQSNVASSTIFWVFGMTRPGVEPWSPGLFVNTLLIRTMAGNLTLSLVYRLFFKKVLNLSCHWFGYACTHTYNGGPHSVMVIFIRNKHSNPSSNWTRILLFHIMLILIEKYASNYSFSSYGKIIGQTGLFSLGIATGLAVRKLWIQTC